MTSKSRLENCRQQIDQIDKQIVDLLNARFAVAKDIAKAKEKMEKKVTDRDREREVISNIKVYSGNEFANEIAEVYMNIIKSSKNIQNGILNANVKVAKAKIAKKHQL